MGSQKLVAKGPRLIDIDILLYGAQTIDTPELQVPHPRMLQRRFVLRPLAEITPDSEPSDMDGNRCGATESAARLKRGQNCERGKIKSRRGTFQQRSTPAIGWANCRERDESTGAMQQQPMQGHDFRFGRFQLDLRKRPLSHLYPAIHTRLGLHSFASVQAP